MGTALFVRLSVCGSIYVYRCRALLVTGCTCIYTYNLALYTPFSFTLYPREIKLVYTDIAIKVPLGHYGRIAPKSGITLKHHVTVLAGVIDPDYTGNMGVVLHNLSSDTKFTRQVGQPIGQLILEVASIFPTLEVGGLPITARGPYGFGSQD